MMDASKPPAGASSGAGDGDMAADGPSKYNDECTRLRERTGALAAVVIVFGGARGSGMAMQAEHAYQDVAEAALPRLLRNLADKIEADTAARGRRRN